MSRDEKQYKKCLLLAQNACLKRETCKKDIREKLTKYVYELSIIEKVIPELEKQGFINEQRYAKAYAHDKFLIKRWGKLKIKQHLWQKQIPDNLIEQGLNHIDQQEYLKVLSHVLSRKAALLIEKDPTKRKKKMLDFGLSRGFEYELIWKEIS
ncbi:MAG: RecX family transcriptional regulator [Bacteroidetes bacterium]|nr:RecX family transcriptional regulator [Bacteroidia bacterium]MBN4052353.1 RecX family transcriptional regulator [Sphingobacteriaceae bacterium AH-315-L07]PCH68572.1 MAG: RecX family transcriptional regulator [Bacteroidota bacterium]